MLEKDIAMLQICTWQKYVNPCLVHEPSSTFVNISGASKLTLEGKGEKKKQVQNIVKSNTFQMYKMIISKRMKGIL